MSVSRPVDHRRSMRLPPLAGFIAVAFAFVVAMLSTTLPTPLYPLYEQEFGYSGLVTTVVYATYAAGVITGLLAFGRLSDAIGRKRVLLPGLALAALSTLAFLLADGLPLLLTGRLLSGLSAGIFTGTATAALLDLAPAAGIGRARATLVATAVNTIGLGLGPLVAGVLVELAKAPLRTSFAVDLALLALATCGLLAVREPLARGDAAAVAAARRPRLPSVPAAARTAFLQGATASFAGFAVLGLFAAIAPAVLGQLLDQRNAAVTGAVVLTIFSASAMGQSAVARLGPDRALVLGCLGLIAGMTLLAAALAVERLELLIASAVVAGLGQGLGFRAGLGAVTAAAPEPRRGEVASAFFTVIYIAISLPVVGVGLLAQATDLKTAGIVFSGLVALLAASVLVPRARPPHPQASLVAR